MQYIIDTNIISELVRKKPNAGVVAWASSVKRCAISVITLEELFYGLALKPNRHVQDWIERFIKEFTEVLPITENIAKKAGTLRGQLQARGIHRTQADLLIASTALVNNLTMVTRNVRDFEGCGTAVLDPF